VRDVEISLAAFALATLSAVRSKSAERSAGETKASSALRSVA
jgi:hypothetical protein